jgi:hypothetical protein
LKAHWKRLAEAHIPRSPGKLSYDQAITLELEDEIEDGKESKPRMRSRTVTFVRPL